jgi:hypothetical protein
MIRLRSIVLHSNTTTLYLLLYTSLFAQHTIETPYHCSLRKANFEYTPES